MFRRRLKKKGGGGVKRNDRMIPTDSSIKSSNKHNIHAGRILLKNQQECTVLYVNDAHLAVCFDGDDIWKPTCVSINEVEKQLYSMIDSDSLQVMGKVQLLSQKEEMLYRLQNRYDNQKGNDNDRSSSSSTTAVEAKKDKIKTCYDETINYANESVLILSKDDMTCEVFVLTNDNYLMKLPWECIEHEKDGAPAKKAFQHGKVKLLQDSNELFRSFCNEQHVRYNNNVSWKPRPLKYKSSDHQTQGASCWTEKKQSYNGQIGEIIYVGDDDDAYYIKFDIDELCWCFPGRAIEEQINVITDGKKYTKDEMEQLVKLPCLIWELEKVTNASYIPGHLDSFVGGCKGFAVYQDTKEKWPADEEDLFLFQINLQTIPNGMKQMLLGDNSENEGGLLQVFQNQDYDCGGDWCHGGYTRIISTKDFNKLVPFKGTMPLTLTQHEYFLGEIMLHKIIGWTEKVDYPIYWETFYQKNYGGDPEELDDTVCSKHILQTKFGGYGSWQQGQCTLYTKGCKYCGLDHHCEVQINIVDNESDSPFENKLRYGDNGTVQHMWCPNNFKKTHSCDGACC